MPIPLYLVKKNTFSQAQTSGFALLIYKILGEMLLHLIKFQFGLNRPLILADIPLEGMEFPNNNHQGGLYLFVNTTDYGHIRILAVERIKELSITPVSFDYPKDFDPEERLESAFDLISGDPFEVKIWFAPSQARYIKERTWSRTQETRDQDDGSIVFSMTTSGWEDVKKWILSYGGEAKVLEPEETRREIMEDLKAMERNYLPSSP